MNKYVTIQTIKGVKDGKVLGQEVLFQADREGLYNSEEMAAADTIAHFLMQNADRIFQEGKTFITFTPSLILRNTPKMFNKEALVIQVEDNVIINPLALIQIKKYHNEGYVFALNDFQFSPKYFSCLEYVDYIKIDIRGIEKGSQKMISLTNIVGMVSGFGKKCIAVGVDTKEAYELAQELNITYMEGSYISESSFTKYTKVEYLEGNFFQLVAEISKDEPDIDILESIFKRDTGLTYSLLKMVNSAYFALKKRISSIRQALVTMGISQLRQWVYLLSFNGNGEMEEPVKELLKTSLLRATFCSALSERIPQFPISKSDAYLIGMFSTLEYLIDAPLEDVLADIPVAEEVKVALISQEGICGRLYQLVLAHERVDWKTVKPLADEMGILPSSMSQMYMNCVDEVNTIWKSLTTMNDAIDADEAKTGKTDM